MEEKTNYNPTTLYNQCIATYVKSLKPTVSQLDEIDGLQMMPPNILADIYLAVSINQSVQFVSFQFVYFHSVFIDYNWFICLHWSNNMESAQIS